MVIDFKTLSAKDRELFDILYAHFGKTINLLRLKFLAKIMIAFVPLSTINFVRLSTTFWAFLELKVGQLKHLPGIYLVNNQ